MPFLSGDYELFCEVPYYSLMVFYSIAKHSGCFQFFINSWKDTYHYVDISFVYISDDGPNINYWVQGSEYNLLYLYWSIRYITYILATTSTQHSSMIYTAIPTSFRVFLSS
jgi:hypothetical protein